MVLIYKIFRADEYAAFAAAGETQGAPIDLADGYVHLSTGDQVAVTASKYFMCEDGLKLLALDADTLGPALKWEVSRGGALFPHLYRPMRHDDVVWVHDLPFEDGRHRFDGLTL
ncbi:DUF952 domain-containing protein [Thalassococcus sp. BH17M4-6]|uniref:DUF952 domain-containing protein n=1 Tax=Thalassococcus sp. BH17M4-6 TaxID=3413148 RepID=UPI003BE0090F